eukprot:6473674-Amphidinium_carterae.1
MPSGGKRKVEKGGGSTTAPPAEPAKKKLQSGLCKCLCCGELSKEFGKQRKGLCPVFLKQAKQNDQDKAWACKAKDATGTASAIGDRC